MRSFIVEIVENAIEIEFEYQALAAFFCCGRQNHPSVAQV